MVDIVLRLEKEPLRLKIHFNDEVITKVFLEKNTVSWLYN